MFPVIIRAVSLKQNQHGLSELTKPNSPESNQFEPADQNPPSTLTPMHTSQNHFSSIQNDSTALQLDSETFDHTSTDLPPPKTHSMVTRQQTERLKPKLP